MDAAGVVDRDIFQAEKWEVLSFLRHLRGAPGDPGEALRGPGQRAVLEGVARIECRYYTAALLSLDNRICTEIAVRSIYVAFGVPGNHSRVEMDHLSLCPEQSELLEAMISASTDFATAARALAEWNSTVRNYSDVHSELQVRRAASENATLVYFLHRREHGC
jgi:hypothetical protein